MDILGFYALLRNFFFCLFSYSNIMTFNRPLGVSFEHVNVLEVLCFTLFLKITKERLDYSK